MARTLHNLKTSPRSFFLFLKLQSPVTMCGSHHKHFHPLVWRNDFSRELLLVAIRPVNSLGIIFFFPFFTHVCGVCLFVGTHVRKCMWRLKVGVRRPPCLLFHIIHEGRLSQFNPELIDMVSLPSQVALENRLSPPSEAQALGIYHGF